ncbi:hypothetical protein BJ742DRAFT_505058 [Cladochytrium replicatum]|nr:hypothetical protein BJ742DRAFT_505058 [Cladochytrium replicatum]
MGEGRGVNNPTGRLPNCHDHKINRYARHHTERTIKKVESSMSQLNAVGDPIAMFETQKDDDYVCPRIDTVFHGTNGLPVGVYVYKCNGSNTAAENVTGSVRTPDEFDSAGCYLVLNVSKDGYEILRDVHVWIGGESSKEARELADKDADMLCSTFTGGAPKFVEEHGNETDLFKSYF